MYQSQISIGRVLVRTGQDQKSTTLELELCQFYLKQIVLPHRATPPF